MKRFMTYCERRDGSRNGLWFGEGEDKTGTGIEYDAAEKAEKDVANHRIRYPLWQYVVRMVEP